MSFCSVVNCMDGRVQLPVIEYLKGRFGADYVDVITEPGPNRILGEEKNLAAVQSILDRLKISVEKHGSVGIAVVGHHDCAGNPAPKAQQIMHTEKAVELVCSKYEGIEIIGLWVDEDWKVHEIGGCQTGQ